MPVSTIVSSSCEGWPASIAAIGLAIAAYPVGVECGFMTRADAVQRTLATLRFFANAPHGPESDATGHKGFYYYFLNAPLNPARTDGRNKKACKSNFQSVGTHPDQ